MVSQPRIPRRRAIRSNSTFGRRDNGVALLIDFHLPVRFVISAVVIRPSLYLHLLIRVPPPRRPHSPFPRPISD